MNTIRKSSGGGSEAEEWQAGAPEESEPEDSAHSAEGSLSCQRSDEAQAPSGSTGAGPSSGSERALDLHWLLKTANPNWTKKELAVAQEKLKQVGIFTFSDIEPTLQGKGILNNLLRDKGLKAFGSNTLEKLRNAMTQERERQRQAELLMLQRERRRLDQETRSGPKASMGAASAPSTDESHSPQEADTVADQMEAATEELTPAEDSEASVVEEGLDDTKDDVATGGGDSASADAANESAANLRREDNSNAVAEQYPSQFMLASKQFRRGLSDGLSCGRSWEWPLTRDEKKERITMLDRQVLVSYEKELRALKAKMALQVRLENESSCDEEEEEEQTFSSREPDSELGIDIAG